MVAQAPFAVEVSRPFYKKDDIFSVKVRLEDGQRLDGGFLLSSDGTRVDLRFSRQDDRNYTASYKLDSPGKWRLLVNVTSSDGTKRGSEQEIYVINLENTIFVAAVAIAMGVISALGRKRLTDIEKTKRVRQELAEFQAELRRAVATKDKAKEEKLRRKQKQIQKMQAEMSWQQLRLSLIFMGPFLGVWYGLVWFVGGGSVLAYSPTPLWLIFFTIGPRLDMFWWYILSSFAFSGITTKLLGAGMD